MVILDRVVIIHLAIVPIKTQEKVQVGTAPKGLAVQEVVGVAVEVAVDSIRQVQQEILAQEEAARLLPLLEALAMEEVLEVPEVPEAGEEVQGLLAVVEVVTGAVVEVQTAHLTEVEDHILPLRHRCLTLGRRSSVLAPSTLTISR